MSFITSFPAVSPGITNKQRAGALTLYNHPRVLELRSIFSSVVVTEVVIQVWIQKQFGRAWKVGLIPSNIPLPTDQTGTCMVPHAHLCAANDTMDIVHTFNGKLIAMECDLAVLPTRSGHPEIWFGITTATGSGANKECFQIYADVTVECSGQSFGMSTRSLSSFVPLAIESKYGVVRECGRSEEDSEIDLSGTLRDE